MFFSNVFPIPLALHIGLLFPEIRSVQSSIQMLFYSRYCVKLKVVRWGSEKGGSLTEHFRSGR